MTAAEQLRADQIRRLAGLADVVGALLAAIPIIEPAEREDALRTCAGLAADIARNLATLTGEAV